MVHPQEIAEGERVRQIRNGAMYALGLHSMCTACVRRIPTISQIPKSDKKRTLAMMIKVGIPESSLESEYQKLYEFALEIVKNESAMIYTNREEWRMEEVILMLIKEYIVNEFVKILESQ